MSRIFYYGFFHQSRKLKIFDFIIDMGIRGYIFVSFEPHEYQDESWWDISVTYCKHCQNSFSLFRKAGS